MSICTQTSPRDRLKIALEECDRVLSLPNLSPGVRSDYELMKSNAEKTLRGIQAAEKAHADLATTESRNQAMMEMIASEHPSHHVYF